MSNSKDQAVKKCIDTMGRLGFMVETFIKLHQTGDHVEIGHSVLEASIADAKLMVENLQEVQFQLHEQE